MGAAIGFAHPTLCGELGIVRMFRVRLADNAEPKPDDKGVVEIKFKQSSAEPISPISYSGMLATTTIPTTGRHIFLHQPPENPENRNKKKIRYLQSIDNTFLSFEEEFFTDGQGGTIEQHYRQVHNIILVHPKLPGVIVRTGDRKEILPMELCIIEPNQLFKKALPEVATREMSGYYQASESLVSAGMQVSRQPMDVDATQMQPPLIEFRGPPTRIREGKWNVVGKKLRKTTEGCHWGVINLAPTKLRSQAIEQHCMAFQKCAIDLGVALGIPIHMQQVDPQSDLIEVLNKFMFVVKQKIGRVATQCVRLNKLPDLRNPGSASQYWNNVVLKVNPRLGGENSSVSQSSAFDKTFRNSGLRLPMIVGADVGHPSPGVRKPSVASLVYNIDPLHSLDLQMRNQAAVTHIIFYRDGVSEGEYDQVKSIEIADIKNAINDVWNTSPNIQQGGFPKPKLTFIVAPYTSVPSNPAGGDRLGTARLAWS
ncbi:hypothetical protein DFP72DRAFT_1073843 [Ephemerocybe angulata]|uniref:Piwi domain-containing protein n=1 Tax=Ephemerocybe angulata TaxID=980116 RepID=A0A8H6HMP6_9AGAR|nr:hypothetical protein DFP72DRAFT_1073843 [Tulosesus angulatus]